MSEFHQVECLHEDAQTTTSTGPASGRKGDGQPPWSACERLRSGWRVGRVAPCVIYAGSCPMMRSLYFTIAILFSQLHSPAYAAPQCVQPAEARALTKGDDVTALDVSCSKGDCRISISVDGRLVYIGSLGAAKICRYDSTFHFEGGGKKDCETNLKSVLFVLKVGNRSDNVSINYADRIDYPGERCFEPEIPQFDDDSTATVEIFSRFRILLVRDLRS